MNFIFFGFMLCLFCNIVFCCVLLSRIILTLYLSLLISPAPSLLHFLYHISPPASLLPYFLYGIFRCNLPHAVLSLSVLSTMFYSSRCGPIAPRRKDNERRAHSQIPKTLFSYLSLFLVSVFDFILDRMASAEPNMKIFVSALGFHYL